MGTLFTNRCTLTKEVCLEAYDNYNKRNRMVTSGILSFMAIIFLLQRKQYSMSDSFQPYLIILCFLASALLYFVVPILQANQFYKQAKELYHEDVTTIVEFRDSYFISTAQPSNATTIINYDQVKGLVSTDHLYLIIINFNMFYIIDKNRFDQIDSSAFIKFMQEKAPSGRYIQ